MNGTTKNVKDVDVSEFKPLSLDALSEILGLTIKEDKTAKLVTFLCQLSAYTDNSQFNVSFNAPSSSGKSYIPIEVERLFPDEDVIELAYCSTTAFFHDVGQWDKQKKRYLVDLSRKILIFLDQPHVELLARLRPLLSHDKKRVQLKITDKSEKYGLRTKNVTLIGFPSVIFCTAGLRIDEQEATRFLLLSPEMTQTKFKKAVTEKIRKESNSQQYEDSLNAHPERNSLISRIRAIKDAGIKEIKISSEEKIKQAFIGKEGENRFLKPRHSRDVGRTMSLIKSHALLNLWHRGREDDSTIIANDEDIEAGLALWRDIAETQELSLPPYVFDIYRQIIVPITSSEWKGGGRVPRAVTRKEISLKHAEIFKRVIPDWQLRQQILPMLEGAGLIIQEADPTNKNRMLVYPTGSLTPLSEDGIKPQKKENGKMREERMKGGEIQTDKAIKTVYPTGQLTASTTPATNESVEPKDNIKTQGQTVIEDALRRGREVCCDSAYDWAEKKFRYAWFDINRMEKELKQWEDKQDINGLQILIEQYLKKGAEIQRHYHQGW
jgi:hypothetical protein